MKEGHFSKVPQPQGHHTERNEGVRGGLDVASQGLVEVERYRAVLQQFRLT